MVPPCGVEQHCSFYVLHRIARGVVLQCNSMSGCPATHKICKNNAITLTVFKDPEVNMFVKVEKKKQYHEDVLFSVCYIFK